MRKLKFVALAALLLATAAPAAALTLQEAVASAYATNPTIAAQRALVRQVDEGVPIARSEARPTLAPSLVFNQNYRDGFVDDGRLISGGLTLGQPIWLGGRVRANLEGAEQRIESARARLTAVENAIIVATVAAYADVLRSASIVRLNENQVGVLQRELQASQDRFEVGDLTRTDVAQAEARLESARSSLIAARTREVEAQQSFRRLTGLDPVNLSPLPPLPELPRTLGEAREAAFARNPDLQASRTDEAAAKADVKAIAGERLGTVGLQVTGAYQDFRLGQGTIGGTISGFGGDVRVTANMPILTGGLLAARTRQAQARQSQLLETITATERLVDEVVTERFAVLRNAEATIASAESAIRANSLAVEGVRQENLVGSRDIIDVLNAEQELLNAEIVKENAERERYVAAYNLLEITGDVNALLSLVPAPRWDPEANARRVRRMGEFAVDPDPREDRQRNSVPLPDTVAGPRN